GIRFYRGYQGSTTHDVHLWTATGQLLATAKSTAETTGWQQVNFAGPVAVQANTTYIASYFSPSGNYAVSGAYFNTAAVNSAPLHAPPTGTGGGNGVYGYSGGVSQGGDEGG